MKKSFKIRTKILKIFVPCFLIFTDLSIPNINYAQKSFENELEVHTNISDESFYMLGPGDILSIKVNDETPLLNKPFQIDGEGIINLPRLERLYVSDLTIKELTNILNKKYSKFLRYPDVKLQVIKYRPIKIFISGEVDNPGFYVLKGEYEKEIQTNISQINQYNNTLPKQVNQFKSNDIDLIYNNFYPSLFFAIRKSGGVTLNADLRNISIVRKNSISNGSGKIKTSINLISAITEKDLDKNIRLLDGDSIFIPRSDNPLISEINKATQTNLNPKFISILLTGRFNDPGRIEVNRGATLLDTINIAGGTKVIKGKISLIRYKSDGTLEKRKFKLRNSAPRGTFKNPYMKNGDILYIEKGIWNSTSEVLKDFTSPLESLISTYGIFKIISGD